MSLKRSRPASRPEAGSFRDRHGRIVYADGRVLRFLSETALSHWRALADKPFLTEAMAAGRVVRTEETKAPAEAAPDGGPWAGVVEHERIPVVSYPYEWSFHMLKDAALLTLDLLSECLEADFILKDGTSYNVQFVGARSVFIDTGSLEPLVPGGAWTGYRQFCQLFLFPLLLQTHKGIEFQSLLRGSLDGPTPETVNRYFGIGDRFRAGVLTHVYLQAKLSAQMGSTRRDVRKDLKSAGFNKELIKANTKRMRALVAKLDWDAKASEWGDYTDQHNYSDADHEAKAAFVEAAVESSRPGVVWDMGANTGQFSRIAAAHCQYVVAADIDQLAVDRHYRQLKANGPDNILPLVMNLADPSPNLGWRLAERREMPHRCRADLVLALALIHHIVISANIPLNEFIAWLADLDADLVIEFVTRDDEQVKKLLLNKEDQYHDYELENFEAQLGRRFQAVERKVLGSGNRYLYYCTH